MANKVREALSQRFLEALSKGQIPWKACWQNGNPVNATTGKPYHGINAMTLSWVAEEKGYNDPRWCTFNQASSKGWRIKKGSTGIPVEYWMVYDAGAKKYISWSLVENIRKNDPKYADKYFQLRVRFSTVFNADQIDGIPELQHNTTNIDVIRQQRDRLIANMGIGYREEGSSAYYSPKQDTVTLPPERSFDDTYSYLCTFLHECGHATGHESRLNRDLTGGFGSASYAREELRAEIASAFTAQALGLQLTDEQLEEHIKLHEAYLQSWSRSLQDAPKELFCAIADAEKISDYLIEKGEFEAALEASQKDAEQEVETNIGTMPVEDYREIKAGQYGFDSYEEMYRQGYRLGNGLDADPETKKREPEKITVVVVEPGRYPYVTEIDPGLKSLQHEVGGSIEAVYPFEEQMALICNEEGKLDGLPLNRSLRDDAGQIYDVVAGRFLVVGLTDEDFGSLTAEQIELAKREFYLPEEFCFVNGHLLAITMDGESMDHREPKQRTVKQQEAPASAPQAPEMEEDDPELEV